MNNNLQVFTNKELSLNVRVIKNNDGSISINLEDAARGLGFVDTSKSATSGAQLEKVRWSRVKGYLEGFGYSQKNVKDNFIPESIFYLLAMKAKNDIAITFQKWLAIDVIPSIRKNGGYIVNQENLSNEELLAKAILVANNVIEEKNKLIEQQSQQLIEQKPLVGFAQQVSDSSDCVDVGEFAKTIRDENIKMGRNILFKWLKSNHYLMSNNNPYQKYINNGMFKVVEVVKKTPYGTKVFTKTLITGIGQIRLLEKIRESYGGNK